MQDRKIGVIFLVDFQIVSTEICWDQDEKGRSIFYRITDPCLVSLLETPRCLLDDAKEKKQKRGDEQRA